MTRLPLLRYIVLDKTQIQANHRSLPTAVSTLSGSYRVKVKQPVAHWSIGPLAYWSNGQLVHWSTIDHWSLPTAVSTLSGSYRVKLKRPGGSIDGGTHC